MAKHVIHIAVDEDDLFMMIEVLRGEILRMECRVIPADQMQIEKHRELRDRLAEEYFELTSKTFSRS